MRKAAGVLISQIRCGILVFKKLNEDTEIVLDTAEMTD